MAETLLDDLVKLQDVETKRKHIQRKCVFSEPVMSLSMNYIADNVVVERTESLTDDMGLVEGLRDLSESHIDKFKTAGYTHNSDIKNTPTGQISNEVDLPWNAIREVEQKIDGKTGFTFNSTENVVETVGPDEVVDSLLDNKAWVSLVLFEHALRTQCSQKAQQIIDSSDRQSRKNLIKQSYDSSRRAESHASKIAAFTRCSEQYVKDVISGRVDEGLSEDERESILKRDDYCCRRCSERQNLEVHHIIPVSQDGTKDESNLCTLCSDCHLNIAHGGNTAEVTYETKAEFWDIVEEYEN